MSIEKIKHYSMQNQPTIFDEEALTALELVGRTAAKVNECVEEVNQIPTKISVDVQEHIDNGDFDTQIDEHNQTVVRNLTAFQADTNKKIDTIDSRVDNLILSNGDSSAEVVDLRMGADNNTYATAGEAVRNQFSGLYKANPGAPLFGLIDSLQVGWTIGAEGVFGEWENRAASSQYANIMEPFYLTIRDGFQLAYHTYTENNTPIANSGWLTGRVLIPAARLRICICRPNDAAFTLAEAKTALVLPNEENYTALNGVNAMAYPLAPLMMGIGSYVAFDTEKNTITIPKDSLLFTRYNVGGVNVPTIPAHQIGFDAAVVIDYSTATSSAIKVLYNLDTKEFTVHNWNENIVGNYLTLCLIRNGIANGYGYSVTIAAPYSVDGNPYNIAPSAPQKVSNMKAICHRGLNQYAPENTLPAFLLAKKNGFEIVECDVQFTADNIAVVIHDETVDRTSNGTGKVSELTYTQMLGFDYGSWFNEEYAGIGVPLFWEVMQMAFRVGLHVYVEIKAGTAEQVKSLISHAKNYNMLRNVTWLSFDITHLSAIRSVDPQARLGYIVSEVTEAAITAAANLKNGENDVFLDAGTEITSDLAYKCIENGLGLERWTMNDVTAIQNTHWYTSGITSDTLKADEVIASYAMNK